MIRKRDVLFDSQDMLPHCSERREENTLKYGV